jgi:hypothetical protein
MQLQVSIPSEHYQQELISCQVACPVHTDARGYVRAIAEGRFEEAYLIARGPNPFASICGRICGAPCETACRRGKVPRVDDNGNFVANDRPIAIRALKRFVCELAGPEALGPAATLRNVEAFVPPVAAHTSFVTQELKLRLRASPMLSQETICDAAQMKDETRHRRVVASSRTESSRGRQSPRVTRL